MLIDVANILSFSGMRGGEMDVYSIPDLRTPAGHANAVRREAVVRGKRREADCYPWQGGGATIATAGLRKRATVRGIFGAEWAKMVTDERLAQCCSLDSNGQPIPYTCGLPENGTVWVVDGGGNRLAYKTNATEDALYATCVVVRSIGHQYETLDGAIVDRAIVAPFLAPDDSGKRQGLDNPLRYRDYRADRVVSLKIGNALAWGDAKVLAEALANGGTHPTEKDASGNPLTVRQIAESLMPNVGEGVTG